MVHSIDGGFADGRVGVRKVRCLGKNNVARSVRGVLSAFRTDSKIRHNSSAFMIRTSKTKSGAGRE